MEQAVFDLRKVQRGRIDKKHVVAINHVLKTQARRYVASLEQVNDAPMASPSWIWLIGAPDPNTTQLVARRTVMPERVWISDRV